MVKPILEKAYMNTLEAKQIQPKNNYGSKSGH